MQHQKVAIPIPETLINGFQCNSVLLCTDYESGTLMLQDGVDSSIIQESLLFFEKLNGDNKPIAVSKVEQPKSNNDMCKPHFNKAECTDMWNYYV